MDTPLDCGVFPLGSSIPYKYVGMLSRHKGKLLLSRQKTLASWENQGGHIEPGEWPLDAARRELYEETGATRFTLLPICDYRARGTSGVLFFAEIEALAALPEDSEMAEVRLFDGLPPNLTHPAITHALFEKLKKYF